LNLGEDRVAIITKETLWLIVLLAAAGALSGCTKTTSAAPPEVPVVPAGRAVRMDMRNDVTLTAELEPFYEVDVMAKEAGYIRHMLVDIGDHVKTGQLICVLEIPELKDDLQRAKADVVTASAEQSAAEQEHKRAVAAESIAHVSYTRILDVSKKDPGWCHCKRSTWLTRAILRRKRKWPRRNRMCKRQSAGCRPRRLPSTTKTRSLNTPGLFRR
jgi:multidrug efflux pump subunit AcrA (membrane-fusion protein)